MIEVLLVTILATSPGLTDTVQVRHVSLSPPRMTDSQQPRPSLVAPIALVAGGALASLSGTGLTLFGLSLFGIKAGCVRGVDCQGNLYRLAAVMVVGGVVLLAAGLVMAIVGHVKLATRLEERAARSVLIPAQ